MEDVVVVFAVAAVVFVAVVVAAVVVVVVVDEVVVGWMLELRPALDPFESLITDSSVSSFSSSLAVRVEI